MHDMQGHPLSMRFSNHITAETTVKMTATFFANIDLQSAIDPAVGRPHLSGYTGSIPAAIAGFAQDIPCTCFCAQREGFREPFTTHQKPKAIMIIAIKTVHQVGLRVDVPTLPLRNASTESLHFGWGLNQI